MFICLGILVLLVQQVKRTLPRTHHEVLCVEVQERDKFSTEAVDVPQVSEGSRLEAEMDFGCLSRPIVGTIEVQFCL